MADISFCFFFFSFDFCILVQFGSTCIPSHFREMWRNHWPGFGLMVIKCYFWAILWWSSSLPNLQNFPQKKTILKHMLLFCPNLRAVGAEHKRTLAATEELGDGTRTFNYGLHLQTGPSASVRIISGGAPWPPPLSPSMNQTFHYMLTLLSCAECVYAMGKWRGIGNLKGDG